MKAPNMSHTVELLYPDSAQARAALAGRKPGSANCCGLNNAKGASAVTSVMPITAMAAPGNRPRRIATMTGARAFHSGVAAFASGRPLGVATVSLDGGA